MKRSLLLLASAVSFANLAAAQEAPILPDDYTILCRPEQSVGLNWKNGGWVETRFEEKDLIVRKSKENQCGPKASDPDFTYDTIVSRNICLNVRKIGEKYEPLMSNYCQELYGKREGGWTTQITCKEPVMILTPDGWFHRAFIHSDLADKPKDDYKDSQYVEVGKCTRM